MAQTAIFLDGQSILPYSGSQWIWLDGYSSPIVRSGSTESSSSFENNITGYINKTQASSSIKALNREAFSLNPSALITLFEIDITDVGFSKDVITPAEYLTKDTAIFRFHNNVKLSTSSIFWRGYEYVATPINIEGFETTVQGTLPTPKLYISVSDEGIPYLSLLKQKIYELSNDLVGAKVTRIRTFAKFLDKENFFDNIPPNGFEPDPYAEFPRDVFYINRKSVENKNYMEFELGSILDVEGVKLPQRLVLANSCPFCYRGRGCHYEYAARRNVEEHGEEGFSILPRQAPPVANIANETFQTLLGPDVILCDRGEYNNQSTYNKGDFVYITRGNINYYFVAKENGVVIAPPNLNYWIQDMCSKSIEGCELRYGNEGKVRGVPLGLLPFGGFFSVNRFS